MDELLIDEKKYVSSKRAAKMTGYAKDYVGQLCREGRVPARLVGRSWYVLESAIQDHRFSAKDASQKEEMTNIKPSKPVFSQKWESPRYVASSEELLPQIQKPEREVEATPPEAVKEPGQWEDLSDPSKYLQDSWKEWFDHIEAEKGQELVVTRNNSEEIEAKTEVSDADRQEIDKEVSIPLHTLQKSDALPPEDLLPQHHSLETAQKDEDVQIPIIQWEPPKSSRQTGKRVIYGLFNLVILVTAIGSALLAAVNSGYIDKYIGSYRQIDRITGISVYTK